MDAVLQAITHTPIWVWPLLALLIWLGVSRMKPRSLPLRRLLILPGVFLVLSVLSALNSPLPRLEALGIWLAGMVLGGLLGRLFAPRQGVVVDRATRRIAVPGSVVPLILILVIFIGRYAFGYAFGRYPELRQNEVLLVAAAGYAALCSGFMLGRTLPLILAYFRTPPVDRELDAAR